jgi:2-phosphosulfolactate phosphatase
LQKARGKGPKKPTIDCENPLKFNIQPSVKLFVYHTPELTPTDGLPDCAVVIDVLRATTTIATALDAGAEAVQTFSNLDKLLQESESWPADQRLRAGERGGKQVEGCDTGNSPLDCTPERVGGRRLFISTTNGTRALQCVENAPTVLAGAQVNRHAVVRYLKQIQPETVWLVGSGWEGSFSLEDTVCAGAIALPFFQEDGGEMLGNDEVAAAIALYTQWQDNLLALFHLASHGQRLLKLNNLEDLKYCAQTDILDVLPVQREKSVLVKFTG